MGLVHVPRTAAAVLKGTIKRHLSPLTDKEKMLVGIGKDNPHVYTSRAGIFDVDIMFHMNNASYLSHAEYARWEWSAFSGLMSKSFRDKAPFIVTGAFVRWRREIPPLKKFDIESRLGGIDDRNMWIYQTFVPHGGGKVLAQLYYQAVLVQNGKILRPRSWLEDSIDAKILDELESKGTNSIFDEKATQFTNLEEVLRRSAAYDDKVS